MQLYLSSSFPSPDNDFAIYGPFLPTVWEQVVCMWDKLNTLNACGPVVVSLQLQCFLWIVQELACGIFLLLPFYLQNPPVVPSEEQQATEVVSFSRCTMDPPQCPTEHWALRHISTDSHSQCCRYDSAIFLCWYNWTDWKVQAVNHTVYTLVIPENTGFSFTCYKRLWASQAESPVTFIWVSHVHSVKYRKWVTGADNRGQNPHSD